jgi:hypothetical protein
MTSDLPRADPDSSSAPDTRLLRIGLIGAGGVLLHITAAVASSGVLIESPDNVVWLVLGGGLALLALALAGLRCPSDSLRWLILAAVVGEVIIKAAVWAQTTEHAAYMQIDSGLYLEVAGELAQAGENPYTWDFAGVYNLYRADRSASTPTLNGATEGDFPYPALGIWLVLPFQWLDLPGAWLLMITAQIAVLAMLFLAAPRAVQPVILLPVSFGLDFTTLGLLGSIDMVWVGLLVAMILLWRRPVWRAVLYGLAVAYKQNVWPLAPFLLIRIWRDAETPAEGFKQAARFAVTSGLTFLIINAPLLGRSPAAWWDGVMTPINADLVMLSQGGLSGLAQFGYVPLPRSFFLLATLVVLALLLFVYWRHYATLRDAFVIMPAILMWFSYRTLVTYWMLWVFPAVALFFTAAETEPAPRRRPTWYPTFTLAAAAAAGLVIAAGIMARTPPVDLHLVPPFQTTDGMITRLTVEVTNRSGATLTPRFAVQLRDTADNPLPWVIESGPLALQPGESGEYHIWNNGQRSFLAHDPGQVVITDAGGDDRLRAVATIGPDRTYLWPDAIPNPEYLYWDSAGPIFWTVDTRPYGAGSLALHSLDGRAALRLALEENAAGPSRIALNNVTTFQPFGLWIYRASSADRSAQQGIEIADGENLATIRFGAQDRTEQPTSDRYVIERAVPPDTWTYQEIDLAAIYTRAGWDPPAYQHTVFRSVEADFRLVYFALFLVSDQPQANTYADFGPMVQVDYRLNPSDLMDETFAHPAEYYTRVGDEYARERNYSRAREAYQQALDYDPHSATIRWRIRQMERHEDETR